MTKLKFTEGPWWVEPETGDIVAKDGDWEICTFSRDDETHDTDRALIVSSKKLYEALEQIADFYPEFNQSLINQIARSALRGVGESGD